MGLNEARFRDAVDTFVKVELRSRGWPVYKNYEIVVEGSEAFVVTPITSAMEVMELRRDPRDGAKTLYAPLRRPELVMDLAELADEPITPEAVRGWAETYGLLGCSGEEDAIEGEDFSVMGAARRESVARFAEAAGEVRMCLRAYEAVTTEEGSFDFEELAESLGPLPATVPPKVLELWDRHKGEERPWLFGVIGRMIQARLYEYCFPQFTIFTRGGNPSGRFALGYGFKTLIGAIWLHMAWLLDAEGKGVRRCKLPDCFRVIYFEPGEPPSADLPKHARGKYKTRSDKEFCENRPCKQNYWYRKNAGWPNYT